MSKDTKQKMNRELVQRALARTDEKMVLTDGEKAILTVLLEKAQWVETEDQKVQMERQKSRLALSGMVGQIVQARGLDVTKFGVNLAAGRIMPIDQPIEEKTPPGPA